MANLNLVGAVAVKVRPDADGFRHDTKRQVMQQLQGVEGEVPVTPVVKENGARVRADVKRVADRAATTADVKLRLNERFLRQDMERVKRALDGFRNKAISLRVEADEAEAKFREHREQVDALTRKYAELHRVKLDDVEATRRSANAYGDLAERERKALDSALARLREVEQEVERVTRVGARSSEREMTRVEKSWQKATEEVEKHRKALAEATEAHQKGLNLLALKKRGLDDFNASVRTEAEQAQRTLALREKLHKKQTKHLVEQVELAKRMSVIETGTVSQVREMLEAQRQGGESLELALDRVLEKAGALNKFEYQGLRQWVKEDFARNKTAQLRVEADTALAEAQLIALERTRSVRILAHLDTKFYRIQQLLGAGGEIDTGLKNIKDKYKNLFVGGGRAAAGVGFIERFTQGLASSSANMDQISVNSARLTTALLSAGGAMTALSGSAFTLTGDLLALGRGALILPAALLTIGSGMGLLVRGMSVAGKAFKENSDAIREYNALVADSIDLLREMWQEADRAGQARFFEQAQDQLARLPETLRPVADAYVLAYETQGRFFSGMLEGLNAWHDSGDMSRTLANNQRALENATGAARPLIQSLLDIAQVGSEHMPELANKLTRVTERWANFVRVSKENGQMDAWLRRSGQEAVNLWTALSNTAGALSAVNKAAEAAGFGGLGAFAAGAKKVNDLLHTDLWQNGMTNIFTGAYNGSKKVGAGFAELGDAIIRTSRFWGNFLDLTGDTVGVMARNTGVMLETSSALFGVEKFLRDINRAAKDSGPLMKNMGDAFGQSATTAGELVLAGQKIADAFFRAWAQMGGLTNGLNQAIPVVADFAVNVIDLAHAFTGPLADGLGGALSWFAGLPAPAQHAALAIGLIAGAMFRLKASGGGSVIAGLGANFPVLARGAEFASGKVSNFRDQWVNVQKAIAGGASFSAVRADLRDIGNGFSTAERNAGLMASGLQQIGGAFTNAKGPVDGFKNAVSGAGTVLKTGLHSAASGLVGFLGGPWGVAFIAAGAILATFAGKAQEAENRVKGMRSSLDEMGVAGEETIRQLSDNFNAMWQDYNGVGIWKERVGEAFERTGKSATQLAQDIRSAGDGTSEYRNNLEDLKQALSYAEQSQTNLGSSTTITSQHYEALTDRQKELVKQLGGSTKLTEEMSQALFGTSEAAGLNAESVGNMLKKYDEQAEALKLATAQAREYANQMGIATADGIRLSQAMEILNSETASTTEKARAFGEAMDVANGGTRAFLQSANDYAGQSKNLSDALGKVREAGVDASAIMVEYENAVGKASWRIDTSVSSLAQLDSALQSSYDSAVSHSQAIYDNALANGKSQQEALSQARGQMSQWRHDAKVELQNLGVEAQQAEAYISDIAGKPWQATLTFLGKTDLFMRASELVRAKGEQFDGEAFTAFLEANPLAAEKNIEAMIEKGVRWSTARFSAGLEMNPEKAEAVLAELYADAELFDAEEFSASLNGDNSAFLESFLLATARGEAWDSEEFAASIGADYEKFMRAAEEVKVQGAEIGSLEWVARMNLEAPGFAETYYGVKADLEGLTGADWQAYVSTNMLDVQEETGKVTGSLDALNGKVSEVTVKSNAAAQAYILEIVRMRAQDISDTDIQQTLKLNDEEWAQMVDGLPGRWETTKSTVEAPLKIGADTTDADTKMTDLQQKFSLFNQSKATGTLDANKQPYEEKHAAVQELSSLFNASRATSTLDANNQPYQDKQAEATRQGQAHNASTYTAQLDGNNAPFGWAKGTADGLGSMFRASIFTATLDGNNRPAAGAVEGARSNANSSWNGKNFEAALSARDEASGTLGNLLGKVGSWNGRVFTATFQSIAEKIGFADGGIMNGAGVQTFASGGFSENHVAQIARPSWPVRVWAEPETGGEAYIPLSPAKRARSTRILREVADRFGYEVRAYADGGATGPAQPRVQAPQASAGGDYMERHTVILQVDKREFARVTKEVGALR